MTRYSIDIDSRLDGLASEARDRLATIPGKPTAADTVREMFAEMVRQFRGGYHPDTASDGYESCPDGYDPELVSALEGVAMDHGLDLYEVAFGAAAGGSIGGSRLPYDGPRTTFTGADGRYSMSISIRSADLPEGSTSKPKLQHAMDRVADAIAAVRTRPAKISGEVGYAGPTHGGYSVCIVDVRDLELIDDGDAAELFAEVVGVVGAVGGVIRYQQPTEHGWTSGKDQEVARRG